MVIHGEQVMSLLLYLVVLLTSVTSVVFGLGWLSTVDTPGVANHDLSEHTAVLKGNTGVAPMPVARPTVCDIQAYMAAYYSFRASDCTYQPYDGPRKIYTKGTPARLHNMTRRANILAFDVLAQAELAQAPTCNISACEAAYRTFDATDCTYQPYEGPRVICEK